MRIARFRLRVLRRVAPPWVVAAVLAALTGGLVWAALSAADREHRLWGATASAIVVTHAVGAGELLDATNAERRVVPRSLATSDTLTDLPAGSRTAVALAPGELLRRARLVGPGVAAPGSVLVAVPIGATTPAVHVGDHLDVYGRAAEPVATDVTVVEVAADRVVIAATTAQAGAIVVGLADGAVALAVRR